MDGPALPLPDARDHAAHAALHRDARGRHGACLFVFGGVSVGKDVFLIGPLGGWDGPYIHIHMCITNHHFNDDAHTHLKKHHTAAAAPAVAPGPVFGPRPLGAPLGRAAGRVGPGGGGR